MILVRKLLTYISLAVMLSMPLSVLSNGTALAATEKLPGATEIYYGPLQKFQNLYVFPSSTPNSPVAILIHGGSFIQGTNVNTMNKAVTTLEPLGYTIVNVDYQGDSSANTAFPMETDDVEAAINWVRSNIQNYNGNPSNISLIGASAGGTLAAMADLQLGGFKKVVTLSGYMDFPAMQQGAINGTVVGTQLSSLSRAFGCSLATCPLSQLEQWSPDYQINPVNCPQNWLILNSATEFMPIYQADNMYAAMKSHSCNATETIVPGSKHAMQYWNKEKTAITSFLTQ